MQLNTSKLDKGNRVPAGSGAYIETDKESGKLYIISANGYRWEIDCWNGTFRIISYGTTANPKTFIPLTIDSNGIFNIGKGTMIIPRLIINDRDSYTNKFNKYTDSFSPGIFYIFSMGLNVIMEEINGGDHLIINMKYKWLCHMPILEQIYDLGQK